MPWVFRLSTLLFLASLPCYFYICWRLQAASQVLDPERVHSLRMGLLIIGAWYAVFPALCHVAYRIRPVGLVPKLMNGNTLTDFTLAYPFWIFAIVAGQIIPYLLVLDAASLTARYSGYWNAVDISSIQARVTLGLVAGVLVFVIVKAYLDTRTIRIRTETVSVPDLPPDLEGFRIAHVSDVHADPRTDPGLLSRFAELVNRQEPDVVMFAGDLVTRGTEHVAAGVSCLSAIRAKYGVFACLGDHDIWSAPKKITSGLRKAGIRLVEDGQETIRVGNATVGVSVVTNAYSSRLNVSKRDLKPEGDVSILLTHQPSVEFVDQAKGSGVDLMLTGHTHGGQIGFNWFGYFLNASSFETPYVSSIYQIDDLVLNVTNGLGLTLAPFRYLAPAEITVITLRSS